ncbi:MAG: orotidine-5'-phosphate decarboxylase [Planctomycetota bacterium]|jgi:orotidine-5'-phosphate decarboxylase
MSNPLPFGERLARAVAEKKNPVCVGLDPRIASLPPTIRPPNTSDLAEIASAYEHFCLNVLDAVCDLVPIVKPQSAFFEEIGPEGMRVLERIVRAATQRGLLVIMDAKRGDIGTTATAYASAFLGSGPPGSSSFSPFGADALTVNPYLGADTLDPFVQRCDAINGGLFVLVKTSNPGSSFLQDIVSSNESISERVANQVESLSFARRGDAGYGPIGAVVGATYPEQLAAMRARMPSAWILIPGYGAQGGAASDVRHGMDPQGLGAVVNSSRGILFAYEQARFAAADWRHSVRNATLAMIEDLSTTS